MICTLAYPVATVIVLNWVWRQRTRSLQQWIGICGAAASAVGLSATMFCLLFAVPWQALLVVVSVGVMMSAGMPAPSTVVLIGAIVLVNERTREHADDPWIWLMVIAVAVLAEIAWHFTVRRSGDVSNAMKSRKLDAPKLVEQSAIVISVFTAFYAFPFLLEQFRRSPQYVGGGRPNLVAVHEYAGAGEGAKKSETCGGPEFWSKYLDDERCKFPAVDRSSSSCRRVYIVLASTEETVLAVQHTQSKCVEQPESALFAGKWCSLRVRPSELPSTQVYPVSNGKRRSCESKPS